jgi:hypothetical protein
MDQSLLMGKRQAASGLTDDIACLCDWQRTLLVEMVSEILPFDILHHQEVHIASLIGIVSGHDICVIELGGGFHFLLKAG